MDNIFIMINYNELFTKCAEFLYWLAPLVGMTYKEINIWIFVIIEPIVFLIMLLIIIKLKVDNKRLKKIKRNCGNQFKTNAPQS